ncbi:MAG: hypothetical protein ACE5MK_07415 [Acidobacteriota bacterium]
MSTTGSISFNHGSLHYTLYFSNHGWLAADMAQYLGDVLTAEDRPIAILKLLGYTMEIQKERPSRHADHWVEIDLERRVLATNSELVRKAVDQATPSPEDPYSPTALRCLHEVLDEHDFTVELF